jgi:ABC-type sugar transport system ATPase subunit
MRRADPALIARRVDEVARVLGIEAVLDRKPAQLSGGQRQRVALGRAMVRQPQAFLLDEPLSNLDVRLRVQTRPELARMHRQFGATMLYVTHDQEEAMTLGDRVAVLRDGRLQQLAPPMEIYRRPANVFVAGFIGSPAMNFFRCTPRRANGRLRLESPLFALPLDAGLEVPPGKEVVVGVRPQDVRLANAAEADLTARVDVIQPLGSKAVIHLELSGEARAVAVLSAEVPLRVGDQVGVHFPRERLHLFDATDEHRLNPA